MSISCSFTAIPIFEFIERRILTGSAGIGEEADGDVKRFGTDFESTLRPWRLDGVEYSSL
jgi:hypothetical protein